MNGYWVKTNAPSARRRCMRSNCSLICGSRASRWDYLSISAARLSRKASGGSSIITTPLRPLRLCANKIESGLHVRSHRQGRSYPRRPSRGTMSEGAETDADLFGIVARRDGAVWGVSAGALLLLFAQWGHAGLGRIVALSVLTVAILIRLYWPLRDRLWFRATIAGIALFHAFMILFYPWPDDQ